MQAKSGKAVTAVEPTEPDEAFEADVADPGKIAEIKAEQIEKKEGKYGSTELPPHKPADEDEELEDEEKNSWIEIELLDEEGNPVPGEKYEIELPEATLAKGTLDKDGFARVEGIEPGTCKVAFPKLDKDAWEKA